MNKKIISITLGVLCLFLAFGIILQVRTISQTDSAISIDMAENKLRDEVLKWKEQYDNTYNQLTKAESDLNTEREKAASGSDSAKSIQDELTKANKMLGLEDAEGPGITLTLDDNKVATTGNLNDYLVHDTDIIRVVNEIKAAGAEAISINDQRVVQTTSINCVGPVILINGERIPAPYVIKAIGKPEYLESSLNLKGGYLEILRSYGITADIKRADSITINKFNGVINLQYAQNAN